MGRYIYNNTNNKHKKAVSVILILDRVDFKRSNIIEDTQGYFIMIDIKLLRRHK